MTVLSAGDSDLAGQSVHCIAASALNVSAPQSSHGAAPVARLAFPASHPAQASPSFPVYPALQVQAVEASLPAGELLFAGQAVHTQLPLLDQYSPALQELHGEHSSPLAPVKPVLQIQSERALLRASEMLFAGQSEHTPDDVCPVDGEYLPAPQSVQLPGPCSSL